MKYHETWRDHAACNGLHEYFDPAPFGNGINHLDYLPHRIGLAICRTCPVLEPCQRWALTDYGCDGSVCGGLTGPQRRAIRRRIGLAHQTNNRKDPAPCGHTTPDGVCISCITARRESA